MKKSLIGKALIILLVVLIEFVSAQELKVGQWRSHFNYTEGINSVEAGDRVYCATDNGLFYVNKEDNSIVRLSKTDGFSEVNISSMGYDEQNDVLMIAYYSTNIDIVQNNTISNIPDLSRKFIIGKKTVNDIYFYNKMAYISTSFGIVVYDEERQEIKETYETIGEGGSLAEIYSVTVLNDTLFASTDKGIRYAPLDDALNLMDYHNWYTFNQGNATFLRTHNGAFYSYFEGNIWRYQDGNWNIFIDSMYNSCRSIQHYNNHLVMTFENRVIALDPNNNIIEKEEKNVRSAMVDSKGSFWYTKTIYTLIKDTDGKFYFYIPNGPASKITWSMTMANQKLYVAGGALTSQGNPLFSSNGMYVFNDNQWENRNYRNTKNFNKVADILRIAVDPVSGHAFIGTYGWGLAEYYDGDIQVIYSKDNSSLQGSVIGDSQYVNIRGLAFDADNNLWISNFSAFYPLSVRKANGKWKSYDLGTGSSRNVGQLVVDQAGQKWITLPKDGGLIVFDENQQGLKYRKLTTAEGQGALPSEYVRSIAVDLNGRIWIGTDDGIGIFYSPEWVFSGQNYDAQKVWVDNGDESGYLLSAITVTAIAVDGANNKWLGTRNGVYYVSDDGTEIFNHFTKENSPLPDNYIRDIAVNQQSGEVFFGTDAGIVSYRGSAVAGGSKHGDVYAYPNPVRPGYTGNIAIRGLVRDANVIITDLPGNMVFETTAEGGQANWDGKNFDGEDVKSGVYLIFSSNEDGTETFVTKILIVR